MDTASVSFVLLVTEKVVAHHWAVSHVINWAILVVAGSLPRMLELATHIRLTRSSSWYHMHSRWSS